MRLTIPALLLLASLAAAPLAPAHAQQNDPQRQATPVPPELFDAERASER